MKNLLSFHLENADDVENPEEVVGSLDDSTGASAEMTETVAADNEVRVADGEANDLEERLDLTEELHDELEPVVTEGAGLDKAGMMLCLVAMRKIAGPNGKHLVGKNVNMESINAGVAGRKEQTRIQFESVKETLSHAWTVIKNAFKKTWARIKTWYITTFDSSKALRSRAEKLALKVEQAAGTAEAKTIKLPNASALAIDGKLKDASAFFGAYARLEQLAGEILQVKKIDDNSNAAEEVAKEIKEAADLTTSDVDALFSKVKAANTISGLGQSVDSKVLAGLGNRITGKASAELPGGKIVINVTGDDSESSVIGAIGRIVRTKTVLADAKAKAATVGEEVAILTLSQVSDIAKRTKDIADTVFAFKKGWENRDKDQAALLKTIDSSITVAGKDDKETDATRNARALAKAATGLVRRDSSFRASFVSYTLSTGNAALTYGERSLAKYKK